MADPLRLIVGLGNPGSQYWSTRHNVGFWFVDGAAREKGVVFKEESRFFGKLARISENGQTLWLLKPSTYMNRSGASVAAFSNYHRIPIDRLLIAHDELDLPAGTIRLKMGGGHGGHNGLRDIVTHLGGTGFWRLRIGIGRPEPGRDVSPYVLTPPASGDRDRIEAAIGQALAHWDAIVSGEHEAVMNILNRRPREPGSVADASPETDAQGGSD